MFPDALRPSSMFVAADITPGAFVHPSAHCEAGVTIDPGAVIGPDVEIGAGTIIGATAVIGPGVRIGRDCAIGAGASVVHTIVGDRVIIHPGCRIGQDGFGFLMGAGGHQKVPQVGRVIIQDEVEIGAGTTIDRGAIRDTVIGEGTKIDNLVQIGHNVADRSPLRHRCPDAGYPAAPRSAITPSWAPASGSTITSQSGRGPSLRRRRSCMATFRLAHAGAAPPPSR